MQANRETKRGNWPTTQISLLERIQDRENSRSWTQFVRIYAPLIMRYCCRRGLQESDARDVVQDVLLQVSKGIIEFSYDTHRGQFRNWLGTIIHRAMLKHLNKSRRAIRGAGGHRLAHPNSGDECQQPLGESWEEAFNAHVYRTASDRIRLQFDRETWEAFTATFVDDHSPEEVAARLQRTVGWVYQAKSKVVRRLKDEILDLAEDSTFFNFQNSPTSRR